jgi:hypothetical protein
MTGITIPLTLLTRGIMIPNDTLISGDVKNSGTIHER